MGAPPSTEFLAQVVRTLRARGLVDAGQDLVVAVSGGADSLALLWALHALRGELELRLRIAHVDHQLRGAESIADAEFVEAVAAKLDLPCHRLVVDVNGGAAPGESMEMTARRLRYEALARVVVGHGAAAVATGHTRDDQAETVLMRIARGGGPGSLQGIGYAVVLNGVKVIRPIRDCSRSQVEAVLAAAGWSWRTDASNRDVSIQRNRVRHEVLPFLTTAMGPGVPERLIRLGDRLATDEAYLRDQAARLLPRGTDPLSAASVRETPEALRARLIEMWLRNAGVDTGEITEALLDRVGEMCRDREGSEQVPVSAGRWIQRHYDVVSLHEETDQPGFCTGLKVPCDEQAVGGGWRAAVIRTRGVPRYPLRSMGVWPAEGTICGERTRGQTLQVRNPRPGDRFRPLGLAGQVSLKDLFINEKVPRQERGEYPVVVCEDEIVWVPGYAVASGWEVPNSGADSLHLTIRRDD